MYQGSQGDDDTSRATPSYVSGEKEVPDLSLDTI
jgi:hypothetical protein